MISISPVDGSAVWEGPEATADEVDRAMARSHEAFELWKHTSLEDRNVVVRRYAELVAERRSELVALISAEVGKTYSDANSEVGAVIGKAELSIVARDDLTGTSTKELPTGTLEIAHRPIGPMVVLGPFNFPAHLPNGHITPALLAGNSVVFKPSEQAPAVGAWMVNLWHEAGLPPDVLQLVQGSVATAEALIDHGLTQGVLFTGGVGAGQAIHRRLAGRPEVMLALELGGNNPIIVTDVADVVRASEIVVASAFLSSGQRCTCARRLIILAGAEGDTIVDEVVSQAQRLIVGPPHADADPFMGPVVSERAALNVLKAQAALIDVGAMALIEAAQGSDGAAYVTPGVLEVSDIQDRDDAEIFGPILQIIRVASFDEAIAEANNTSFGLAAGVVTDNDELWSKALAQLNAGIVNRNLPTVGASGAAPFGGTGLSGNHRPAGYNAAAYCAYPVASLIKARP